MRKLSNRCTIQTRQNKLVENERWKRHPEYLPLDDYHLLRKIVPFYLVNIIRPNISAEQKKSYDCYVFVEICYCPIIYWNKKGSSFIKIVTIRRRKDI